MSRIPKKYMNTSFFHIMIQGINKEYIFKEEKDIKKYIKIIKETKEGIELQIVAYCIMNNHVHLLIYTNDKQSLIKFMHRTNLMYAKYYNNTHKRVGYVFRDRYKTQPILYERHLYNCIDYIHKNPVKAHICSKCSEYKYSSYNHNLFEEKTQINQNIRKYINSKKFENENDETFILLENEEKQEICENIIYEFLSKNNIKLEEIQENKELLIGLINNLRNEYKISYRMIQKNIGIGRETLRKLCQ